MSIAEAMPYVVLILGGVLFILLVEKWLEK